ncbi:MAG TPA: hypothetical protein VMU59_08580, partial [Caulobacteraceae bacterium]|nr:hypothetical protein [Caulobacteraceae bacterium]
MTEPTRLDDGYMTWARLSPMAPKLQHTLAKGWMRFGKPPHAEVGRPGGSSDDERNRRLVPNPAWIAGPACRVSSSAQGSATEQPYDFILKRVIDYISK